MTELQSYRKQLGQMQASLDRANGEIERLNDRINLATKWLTHPYVCVDMATRILRGESDEDRS